MIECRTSLLYSTTRNPPLVSVATSHLLARFVCSSPNVARSVRLLFCSTGSLCCAARHSLWLARYSCFSRLLARSSLLLFSPFGSLIYAAFLSIWLVHRFLLFVLFGSLHVNAFQAIWLAPFICLSGLLTRSIALRVSHCARMSTH